MRVPRLRAPAAALAALGLGALAALAACAAGAGGTGWEERPERGDRPNLVVILADDLGWGEVGVYGQRLIWTPRLDAMAAEGTRFTQFYSAAPYCPPAREALLTGFHTGHTVVRVAGVLPPDSAVAPRYLPRMLAGAGYVTGMFGKWGMGAYETGEGGRTRITAGWPERLGFTEFLGAMVHRDAHAQALPPYPLAPGDEPIHPRLWTIENGATRERRTERVPFTQDRYLEAALDFIERHRDRPFFLYLPWTLPHAELYLPPGDPAWEPYLDAAGESVFPEEPFAGDRLYRRPNPRPRATYAAMITRLDRDVGAVLDRLEALGLAEDTVVVFTSDNGPHSAGGIGDPGFFDSTGGLAGSKGSVFEGGIRVPAIVRWPGTVEAGRVVVQPHALQDVAPTFLELAGVPAPEGLDGISMAPLLRGEAITSHDAESPLYWEAAGGFRGAAVRVGRWKLMRRFLESEDDPVRLTDLVTDPLETRNVAGRPELCPIYLQLVRLLNAERVPPPPPTRRFEYPPLREECPAGGRPGPRWPPPDRG